MKKLFVAEDGSVFDTEAACVSHERRVNARSGVTEWVGKWCEKNEYSPKFAGLYTRLISDYLVDNNLLENDR